MPERPVDHAHPIPGQRDAQGLPTLVMVGIVQRYIDRQLRRLDRQIRRDRA